MNTTGLPSIKLMKTYLSSKAHKESKLTHLKNFVKKFLNFSTLQRRKTNPQNETVIHTRAHTRAHTHTTTKRLQQNESTQLNLETTYP